MTEFSLRPMVPADSPALDALMRSEAHTQAMGLSTRFAHDIFQSLLAQSPTLLGVVAEAPGVDGLVGMATVTLSERSIGGTEYPAAFLENLKVHHDFRRQGLGSKLARWRIEQARQRFDGPGIVLSGIEASNTASLATARSWSSQAVGPVRVVIARVSDKQPGSGEVEVRPLTDRDVEAVVDGANAFHQEHDLYRHQTPDRLAAWLAPTSLGEIHQYRVAVSGGRIVAGAGINERFKLMTERVDHIPRPLELIGRVVPVFPPDRVIRNIELQLVWFAPGHAAAARRLWDAIRYEWRDRASHVAAVVDPRAPLADVIRTGPSLIPRIRLMVPVAGPVPIADSRLVYLAR